MHETGLFWHPWPSRGSTTRAKAGRKKDKTPIAMTLWSNYIGSGRYHLISWSGTGPCGQRGEGLDEPVYNEGMANCLSCLLLVQVALSCYSWITSYLRTQDDPGPEISPNEALRALQTASQCHQRPVDADVGETRILQRLERCGWAQL